MSEIDDLNVAVTKLSADVATLIAKPAGVPPAQVAAVTAAVNALDAQVVAANTPTP